jgi:hypothetical protein
VSTDRYIIFDSPYYDCSTFHELFTRIYWHTQGQTILDKTVENSYFKPPCPESMLHTT